MNFIIDILLKSLIIAQQFNQYQKTKKYYKNCNKRIIVDNYNFIELQSITNNFWNYFANINYLSIDCYLRSNLDFLLNYFMLLQDKSKKYKKFFNLQFLYLENEYLFFILTSCLLYITSNSKINQNNKIKYIDVLQYRDLYLCILNAIINYFVSQ